MSAARNSLEASRVFPLQVCLCICLANDGGETADLRRVPAYPKTPGGDDVEVSY
jgi:hypothetical protein